jgi:hypothetical protein
LPVNGQQPTGCYNLLPANVSASSGNPQAAIDGNQGSRWESAFADPQHLIVDLGVLSAVSKITISWEIANAKNYYLLGSADSISWDTIAVKSNMSPGNRTDIIDNIGRNFRYVKMQGVTRNTPYGYSIWEMEVCGTAAGNVADQRMMPGDPVRSAK